MRRFIVLIMTLVICVSFSGCFSELQDYHTEKELRNYAQNHEELILSCVNEAYALYPERRNRTIQIRPISENAVQDTVFTSDGGILSEVFDSGPFQELFSAGIFKSVIIKGDTIQFHADYYAAERGLAYVPSGDPKDLNYYDDRMEFRYLKNGYYGCIPGRDNTFYYSEVSEHIFFFEAHY